MYRPLFLRLHRDYSQRFKEIVSKGLLHKRIEMKCRKGEGMEKQENTRTEMVILMEEAMKPNLHLKDRRGMELMKEARMCKV